MANRLRKAVAASAVPHQLVAISPLRVLSVRSVDWLRFRPKSLHHTKPGEFHRADVVRCLDKDVHCGLPRGAVVLTLGKFGNVGSVSQRVTNGFPLGVARGSGNFESHDIRDSETQLGTATQGVLDSFVPATPQSSLTPRHVLCLFYLTYFGTRHWPRRYSE